MARPMPAALPRQIISLLSILLVVFLVAFPSSASIVAILVLLGGGAFMLQSKAGQAPKEVQMQSMEDAIRLTALKSQPGAQKADIEEQLSRGRPKPSKGSQQKVQEGAESQRPEAGAKKAIRMDINANGMSSADNTLPENGAKAAAKADGGEALKQKLEEKPAPSSGPKQAATAPKETSNVPRAKGSATPLAGGAAVLARLRQQRAAAKLQKPKQDEAREVIVAYASQTGTAQEIAKGIQAESAAHGIKTKVSSLNELGFEALAEKTSPVLVIVASSTGDGDAPDNAAKFYATMRKRTQEAGVLSGVKFTCLGLGDSNYTRFMGVSRAIRTRLQELGAETFYKMGEADEVDGLENVVDTWIADLWAPLKAIATDQKEDATTQNGTPKETPDKEVVPAKVTTGGLEGVPALSACQIGIRWIGDATESSSDIDGGVNGNGRAAQAADMVNDQDTPFLAPIKAARYLTARSSEKKVLHLELGTGRSPVEYQPGDSISLLPQNEDSLVDALQERLGLEAGATFRITSPDGSDKPQGLSHISRPCTVRQALQRCDITSAPRKSLLRTLAEHCSNESEKQELLRLSSKGGRQDYAQLITPISPTLVDLLNRYPSCCPPWAVLLDALQPLPPRLYSISSSPLEHPGSMHIAFTVVRVGNPEANISVPHLDGLEIGNGKANGHGQAKKELVPRWGVASGWLERKAGSLLAEASEGCSSVQIRLRKGGAFSHPSDLSAPVLMIGPGTGVAPFRGFLQHRRQLAKTLEGSLGPAILYFGCRSRKQDFLYRDELQAFAEDGILTKLELAFSRETAEKVYVQDLMKRQGKTLAPILSDSKAYIFICGDGAHMAKDVNATLLSILEEHSGMSSTEAIAHLADMTKAGHYIRDIWS